jgi:excisionase family DNA binding protein
MHDNLTTRPSAHGEARKDEMTGARHYSRGGTQGGRRSCAPPAPGRLAARPAPRSPTMRAESEHAPIQLAEAFRPLISEVVREELAKQQPAAPDVFLSTRAAAAVAGVASGTIRRWVEEGRLTGHRAGRVLRIRRAELEQQLAAVPRRSRRREAVADMTPEALARRDFR